MKLYYAKGACSLAPHILLRELDAPCEFVAVNLATHTLVNDGSDFYKINSKGAVPALLLDNGEFLTENAVIQQYLADTFKAKHLLPPIGDMRRYHVLEWLNYVSTELHKGFSPLFNKAIPQNIKDEVFMPALLKKFDYVNQRLMQRPYLVGDEFTLPDIYAFVILNWAKLFNLDLAKWPNLARYYKEIYQRPSVKKAFAEEGLSNS